MSTLTIGELEIPLDIGALDRFREWSGGRPEGGPLVSFVDGSVYVDVSDSYDTHAPVTTEVNVVLAGLVRELGLGVYFMASSWFTCKAANISTEPDGFFARNETLRAGLLQVNPLRRHEALGRPDFVFEAVSRSSVRKDLTQLVDAYARAGIGEYWVVDARKEELLFRALVLKDGVYEEVAPDTEGWRASPTWGRAFRLRRITNSAGLPDVRLDVR